MGRRIDERVAARNGVVLRSIGGHTFHVLRARSAFSDDGDPEAAARRVASGLASVAEGVEEGAVLFFATEEYGPAYDRISRIIAVETGLSSIVGCSAARVDGPARADGDRPTRGISALALAGSFEAERFFLAGLRGRAEDLGREIGRRVGRSSREPVLVVLLADSYNLAPDELLAGVGETAGGVPVVGAGASERGSTGETVVIGRGACSANAVAGVVLRGLSLHPVQSPVLTTLGPSWRVTQAEANRVEALDGRPALERVLDVLPASFREDPAACLPLLRVALRSPEAEEVALWRPIVGADLRRGALAVGDEVRPGARLELAVAEPARARARLEESLRILRGSGAEAVLHFHSALPGEEPYGLPNLEAAYVERGLGDMPIAGFATYVTISPQGGRNRFQHYAGLLAGIGAPLAARGAIR